MLYSKHYYENNLGKKLLQVSIAISKDNIIMHVAIAISKDNIIMHVVLI